MAPSQSASQTALIEYFTLLLLQEQDRVTVDTIATRANEEGLKLSYDAVETEIHDVGSHKYTQSGADTTAITGVSPTTTCPPAVSDLFDAYHPDGPTPEELVADSESPVSTAGNTSSQMDPIELEAVSEAHTDQLADNGFSTVADLAAATVPDIKTIPGIGVAQARKIARQAELAATPDDHLAAEALAHDLGVDVGTADTLSVDDVAEQAASADRHSVVTDIEKVQREPGEPVYVNPEWDGDEWHYQNLPILTDIGHELVPDMSESVKPREITLTTGEQATEAICNTLRQNTRGLLLEGPHGCGKNYLIEWLMWKTNRPVVSIDLNESMLAEQLIGTMMPQEDGSVAFENKLIPNCVKHGIPIIFNELRAAPPDITMALHQLLQNGRLTIEESGEQITPHPNFRFIATTNPNTVEYDGAGSLNDAFLDRLRIIPMDYLPEKKEIDLLDEKFNRHTKQVSRDVIRGFVTVANQTREQQSAPTLSTRQLEDAIQWSIENTNPRGTIKTALETRASRRSKIDSLKEHIEDVVPQALTG